MEGARRSSGMMLSIFLFLALAISSSTSSYVITGPLHWVPLQKNQICVNIPDEESSGGFLEISAKIYWSKTPKLSTTLEIKPGVYHECLEIELPFVNGFGVLLTVTGHIDGSEVQRTMDVGLMPRRKNRTFIQTDKHLYKPGQRVQFRILTLHGREAQVSSDRYLEVYVETPSGDRVAQWNNVDNSAGIVHLAFQLAHDSKKGDYRISAQNANGRPWSVNFKVDDYGLPRFEVTVTPPKIILATDTKFTFRVCAKYTFGQPVKGTLNIKFSNNKEKKCIRSTSQSLPITDCTDVEVASKDMKIIGCYVDRLIVTASVEEEGTGVTMTATTEAKIERTPVKLIEVYADKYKKPNLPYFVEVQAMLLDNTPARDIPIEVCASGVCTERTTGSDGFIRVALLSDKSNRIVMSTLNCGALVHSTSYTRRITHLYSPSKSSLQILAPKRKPKCVSREDSKVSLDVMYSASDQSSATLNIQVISRGREHFWFTKHVELKSSPLPLDEQDVVDRQNEEGGRPVVTGMLSIPISLPPTDSSTIQVLVWYKRSDGEVVADSLDLEVEKCLPNQIDLKWSAEQGQPGDVESFTLTGEPHSVCSVSVVDKSTEHLNPEPNLIKIFDYLDSYKTDPGRLTQIDHTKHCHQQITGETEIPEDKRYEYRSRYSSEYADALYMFINSDLFLISDLTLETRPCKIKEDGSYDLGYYRDEETRGNKGSSNSKKFPETWLFNIVVLPDTGVLKEEVTLPDTITEWAGTAVCAHPEKGVGVSDPASITTFTPFFTEMTFLSSVKRGEILAVNISVFNYLKESLPVTATLLESPEYEVVEDEATGGSGNQRHSCLGPQHKAMHTIKIRPLALGDVNIALLSHVDTVSGATCGTGHFDNYDKRNILNKPLKVKAEGFLREITQSKYVCAGDEDASLEWQIDPPSNIVPDSEHGWLNVVGNLVTLSIENLDSLMRMPYGYFGGMNMINFAPNIFILQYLKHSEQNVPEAEAKLLHSMRAGYQRALHYQGLRDGSFHAFGNQYVSGSTWLTAFFLKSFVQAKDFIDVDDSKISKAREFLYKSQTDDNGCIIPIGTIIHKGFKEELGEKNSSVAMTAYVVAALLESGSEKQDSIVKNGTQCLLQDSSRDPYTVALKAYAMALAGVPKVKVLLKQMKKMAVKDNDGIHWNLESGNYSRNSLAVETAGYFILATLSDDPSQSGQFVQKVVKWITTHRNGKGGFYSTQDTVVALQAMAKYETLTTQFPVNLVATLTAQGSPVPFEHKILVNESNKVLQQQKTIPSFPTTVEIALDGQGCVIVQSVLRYNIPEPEGSTAFSLSVESQNSPDRDCTPKSIKACVSYLLSDGKSNIGVIEVNLISGYIPEVENLKYTVFNTRTVERYEEGGSKVSFYVDGFTGDELCISLPIIREVKVEDTKPGSVVVYDYYQPELTVSESYSLTSADGCER